MEEELVFFFFFAELSMCRGVNESGWDRAEGSARVHRACSRVPGGRLRPKVIGAVYVHISNQSFCCVYAHFFVFENPSTLLSVSTFDRLIVNLVSFYGFSRDFRVLVNFHFRYPFTI